jgi:mono/diheme cytochrome c family protein
VRYQRLAEEKSNCIMWKLGFIIAMCVAAVGAAKAQSIGSASQGLRLARAQCAECHHVEKGPGLSPIPAAPTFEDIANIHGMTSAALTVALRTSHETMPNVIIKGPDTSDLVAYILSLKD